MEALELLGSRYIKPEQVAVGPVETLRAQNAATWRVVLIHRVSTARESSEQADLLKLLTTALVRSSEAKRLVLDFGEEQGFWNVVTESEPQCESLRDWLQAEVDGAEKGEAILSAEQAAAMGEFARLFARGAKHTPRKVVPAKASKPPAQPPPAEPKPVEKQPEPVAVAPEPETPPVPPPLPAAETAPLVTPVAVPVAEPVHEPVPLPVLEQPPVLAEVEPVAEIDPDPAPAFHPQEPEIPVQVEEERPIVLPDEIPVIVISAPPLVGKVNTATQSIAESKPPVEDAIVPPPPPLPPRPFLPPRPPLTVPPVAETQPLIPEIVTELPKAVADAPKVIPIDGRPHEPRTEEPALAKATAPRDSAARGDAPLFANSMPKPARLSKMTVFFIVLGVVALLLILVIVYLSNKP